jgi:hypothetical protein
MRRPSPALRTFALLAAIAMPGAMHAQFPADIQAGARVRAWVPESYRQREGPVKRQLLRGTVASVVADTMYLAIPGTVGTVAVPRATIRKMQLSQGEPSRVLSAIERAMGGALGGAVTYAMMNDPRRRGGPHYRTDWHAAGVGAAWGAGFGAVYGLVVPHEHWKRVRLRR